MHHHNKNQKSQKKSKKLITIFIENELTMFTSGTTLRYYPSSEEDALHYTAVVTKDNQIIQVKGGEKQMFDTIDAWLQSLPGSPPVTALVVQDKEEVKKVALSKKESKPKKVKWNKPSQKIKSAHLAIHIYKMINEADPTMLDREDIRDAYNHLVDRLVEYRDIIQTYSPSARYKYTRGFNYGSLAEFQQSHYISLNVNVYNIEYNQIKARIYEAYRPLYEMIKHTINCYMGQKADEQSKKEELKQYKKKLAEIQKKQMKMIQKYQNWMALYQGRVDQLTENIAKLES